MNRVVLYQPEKPANVGNIIRTCMAFDLKLTIIGPLTFTLDDHALKRAEMDYAIGFEIERFDTFEEFLKAHPNEEGYYVTRYSNKTYSDYDLKDVSNNYPLEFQKRFSSNISPTRCGFQWPSTQEVSTSLTVSPLFYPKR